MNREPGDCVATHFGFQGFAVVAVKLVQHPQRGWVKLVRIKRRDGQHKYSGLQAADLKKIRELERENARLQQLYTKTSIENQALKKLIHRKL